MGKQNQAANYSPEQEAAIRDASPLNLDSAKALADEIGKSYRSVIAKARSMGVPYENKAKPAKRVGGLTKAQMVEAIAANIGANVSQLEGLEKATARALALVLAGTTSESDS